MSHPNTRSLRSPQLRAIAGIAREIGEQCEALTEALDIYEGARDYPAADRSGRRGGARERAATALEELLDGAERLKAYLHEHGVLTP